MERQTLSFPSVFDLHDFRKEVETKQTEARVNLLTGYFTLKEVERATSVYKAEVIKHTPN